MGIRTQGDSPPVLGNGVDGVTPAFHLLIFREQEGHVEWNRQ